LAVVGLRLRRVLSGECGRAISLDRRGCLGAEAQARRENGEEESGRRGYAPDAWVMAIAGTSLVAADARVPLGGCATGPDGQTRWLC